MLEYNGHNFNMQKRCFIISDEQLQDMIDEVTGQLKKSKHRWDFCSTATGDSLVAGIKCKDEIDIWVTRNYNEAILLQNKKDKKWVPIDWQEK